MKERHLSQPPELQGHGFGKFCAATCLSVCQKAVAQSQQIVQNHGHRKTGPLVGPATNAKSRLGQSGLMECVAGAAQRFAFMNEWNGLWKTGETGVPTTSQRDWPCFRSAPRFHTVR